jgi:heme/copper-type cytochrome/quinol oxidase subunit 3
MFYVSPLWLLLSVFAFAASFWYIDFIMPDNLLLIIFGILSTIALLIGCLAIYLAVKNAKKKDGELMMVFWAVIALAGLTFAGMSWAYFLIPILANRLF